MNTIRKMLFFVLVLILVAVTSCTPAPAALLPAIPTATNPPTPVPATATPVPTATPAQEAWDLLVISDSSNWGVGEYYAKLIEQDMQVKVNLHDCWVGNLAMGTVLTNLKGNKWTNSFFGFDSCKKPWPELVKEAEVMVLFGNALYSRPSNGAWDGPVNPDSCFEEVFIGKSDEPGALATYKEQLLQSCAPETYNTYRADLSATLDEIEKIREGKPLILRMTDIYIPVHSSLKSENMDDVCTTCVENFSQAIHQVAEQHEVVVVSTMDGLNGKDHQLDPREKDYIGFDGIHLSDAGAEFVAKLLQQSGYAYSTKIQ